MLKYFVCLLYPSILNTVLYLEEVQYNITVKQRLLGTTMGIEKYVAFLLSCWDIWQQLLMFVFSSFCWATMCLVISSLSSFIPGIRLALAVIFLQLTVCILFVELIQSYFWSLMMTVCRFTKIDIARSNLFSSGSKWHLPIMVCFWIILSSRQKH